MVEFPVVLELVVPMWVDNWTGLMIGKIGSIASKDLIYRYVALKGQCVDSYH
jgi:hypothetical protein